MIQSIVWNCDPEIFTIGNWGLRYYSLCWLIGFALGYYFVKKIFIEENLNLKYLESLLVYVCIGAFAGARLGHCIFYDWQYYSHNIIEIILPVKFSPEGVRFIGYAGLASHGGAIGVIIALAIFCRKHKWQVLSLCDKLGFVAPLAGAFIRIGNFFNSEIVGAPTATAWGVVFQRVDTIPRHPAQLYEAAIYLLIFIILSFVYQYKKEHKFKDGGIFGLSITLIFVSRFIIEYYKEVQEPFEIGLQDFIGLDMGQLLSIPFMFVGLYFTIRAIQFPKRGN